jgi:hypothetical protein
MTIGCPFKEKSAREDLLTLWDILDGCVVYTTSSCSSDLCWIMRWLVVVAPRTRSKIPPWCSTVSNDVTNLTIIIAGVGHYAHLLLWWVQHGRRGCHSSRYDILIWRWTGSQLMMMLLWWVVMWSTHHPVLVRGTARWGCQSLLLLAFLMSTDGIIHNDGIAHKFQESPIGVERKALLKLGG